MGAMAGTNPFRLDFDGRVEEYGRHRRIHPEVLRQLLESGLFGPETRVLDVGCGTGNYAAALTNSTNCLVSGVDIPARIVDYVMAVGAAGRTRREMSVASAVGAAADG